MAPSTTNTVGGDDILTSSYEHGTSMLPLGVLTKPLKTYLFGNPISHSMAPLLHNTLFEEHGVPWNYSLFESLDDAAFLQLLKADNCIGSAVTMPHKINFMSHVDHLTEEGRIIGSINTVFIRLDAAGNKRYIGTNTDCIGVREAFLQNIPGVLEMSRGKPALVIGGGGACRSSVYAVWKWLGASKVYLINRVRSEVDEVIAAFKAAGFMGELLWIGSVEEAKALETPGCIVGTIPDYPPKAEGELVCRAIAEEFLGRPEKGAMLEMCYHPKPVTALYRLAEEAGWKLVGGTEAMVHQGIAQQILWKESPLEDFRLERAQKVVQAELETRWTH
ncbi:NAD-P-binding protein [Tricharina praecox]|uniref:NAD-P-binding protein n=1 Tax=Tricharina praecox TaxID=43433 RepID=UPI0022200B6F|nr:NAD-P-binding protein [Tricharina praecox]KAI5858681.1 NAD-P-binding protein [Tricharina praecox]